MKNKGPDAHQTPMRDFVVEVERPSSADLAAYTRAERYRIL